MTCSESIHLSIVCPVNWLLLRKPWSLLPNIFIMSSVTISPTASLDMNDWRFVRPKDGVSS